MAHAVSSTNRLRAVSHPARLRGAAARLGLLAAGCVTACAPALNWREVRAGDAGAMALLPCKPDQQARRVALAGAQVRLHLLACSAGGATWALAYADVEDPARVGPALAELSASAAANLAGTATGEWALQVPGATPNAASRRLAIAGRMPDGRAASEQLAVFAKGTRVFQATVLGEKLVAEDVQAFFASLRFVS
jgi:hypothetical protein